MKSVLFGPSAIQSNLKHFSGKKMEKSKTCLVWPYVVQHFLNKSVCVPIKSVSCTMIIYMYLVPECLIVMNKTDGINLLLKK